MIRGILRSLRNPLVRRMRLGKLSLLRKAGLPPELLPAVSYLVTGAADADATSVAAKAEMRRSEIASMGSMKLPIWYSPKPGSARGLNDGARPQPGKVMEFSAEQIAKTGKNRRWGGALHLLSRSFKARNCLELGACAGISGIYIASTPFVKSFITVEGAAALAAIASESLSHLPQAKVLNCLFDEAIDNIGNLFDSEIDFAYIDGHHEKAATLHYCERIIHHLSANAVVVFDDISWSEDMRDAWSVLSNRREFAHAVDFGAIGVCVMKPTAGGTPKYWDLQPIVGKCEIGSPKGWAE